MMAGEKVEWNIPEPPYLPDTPLAVQDVPYEGDKLKLYEDLQADAGTCPNCGSIPQIVVIEYGKSAIVECAARCWRLPEGYDDYKSQVEAQKPVFEKPKE